MKKAFFGLLSLSLAVALIFSSCSFAGDLEALKNEVLGRGKDGEEEDNPIGGTGEPNIAWYNENPGALSFTIYNADELAGLSQLVNQGVDSFEDKTVALGASIDISVYGESYNEGKGWIPIGYEEFLPFKGSFEGNNKSVINIYINCNDYNVTGLFGIVDGGTIKNLDMKNVNYNGGSYAGSAAGVVYDGEIKNCSVSAGIISGTNGVGGVLGYIKDCNVSNCSFTAVAGAKVKGEMEVGGIIGYVLDSTVSNCFFSAGEAASGEVNGASTVGGISGIVWRSDIINCYSAGEINGESDVGGIAGWVDEGTISNCYATGAVSGDNNAGGVAGSISTDSNVSNCAALNPSVTRTSVSYTNFGRIAGDVNGSLTNNVAFSGMSDNGEGLFGTGSDINKDGEGITKAQIAVDITFGDRFIPAGGWTTAPGALPGLFGKTVAMPEHLMPDVPGTPSTAWYDGGSGPFTIYSADELAGLAQLVNDKTDSFAGKTVKLGANLDLAIYGEGHNDGKGWIPIGLPYTVESEYNYLFRGNFDGNNKVISNLYINMDDSFAGLFGAVAGGTIKDLGVENVKINSSIYTQWTGGVAGRIRDSSTISNCYTTGTVSGWDIVGGVVGQVFEGTVIYCHSTCTVSGDGSVGGVAGRMDDSMLSGLSRMSNCYATGEVSGNNYIGGMIGRGIGEISNCYVTAAVNGKYISSSYIGGIAGTFGSTINNCYSTGTVIGDSYIGGIAGAYGDGIMSNCYATGSVSGSYNVGGIAGYVRNSISSSGGITNCYSTGTVNGNDCVGGVAGRIMPDAGSININNCYATGLVRGENRVGGVAGLLAGSYLSNCTGLNPGITRISGEETTFGRVVGTVGSGSFITNNMAYSGMTAEGGISFTGEDHDGADISKVEVKTRSTYEDDLGWKFGNDDDNPWKWDDPEYPLPVLYWQGPASYPEMPGHLK